MQNKTIQEVQEEYDLELDRIVKAVKKEKAKKVLIQLPDGLKLYATVIVDELEKQLPEAEFFIWMGSCYGACDIPHVKEKDFDMIVQFGHSPWNYKEDSGVEVVE